jgi:hypothetical protein
MIIGLFSLTIVATFFTAVGITDRNPGKVAGICIGAGVAVLVALFALAWYLQDTLLTMKPIL